MSRKINSQVISDSYASKKPSPKNIIDNFEETNIRNNEDILKLYSINIFSEKKYKVYFIFKRTFDFLFSLFLLILFSPLWLSVFVLIKIESPGSVIYKQKRIGKNGKEFELYKFRSMIDDAEKYTGPIWAIENDLRITKFGSIIRKFGIDEMPQLINVLKGEMSLIGPRPERPFFIEKFGKIIPLYTHRYKVLPGITGLAQIKHKYDSNIEDVIKKLQYDLCYINNLSFKLDIIISLTTIYIITTGKGKF